MLLTVTCYPDDEPCTWPVVVSESGNLLAALGHTDRGTHDGTTSFRGVEYRLVPCEHAPHWTQLVPVLEA